MAGQEPKEDYFGPMLQALKTRVFDEATFNPLFSFFSSAQPQDHPGYEKDFLAYGGYEIIVELLKSTDNPRFQDAALAVVVFVTTAFPKVCELLGTNVEVIRILVSLLENGRNFTILWVDDKVPEIVINCLGFIASADNARDVLLSNGALEVVVGLLERKAKNTTFGSMLAIANLVGTTETKENKHLAISEDVLVGLMQGFKEEAYEGSVWPPSTLFPALRRLSINDHNKIQLVKKGVAPIWVSKIAGVKKDERTLREMLEMMLNLSFLEENHAALLAAKVPETLKELAADPIATPQKSLIEKILWKLNAFSRSQADLPPISGPGDFQIMISYNWGNQAVVKEVVQHMKEKGFKVWWDMEQMTGSTLETMANAVETSTIVLVCVSRKYKESPNCRLEGEYAFQKRKIIIPLIMEPKYSADGWLGALLGTKLYFDFSNPQGFPSAIQGVLKELKKHAPPTPIIHGEGVVSTPAIAVGGSPTENAKVWNIAQVGEWMESVGLQQQRKLFEEQGMNGKSLAGLAHVVEKGFPLWGLAPIQPGGAFGFTNHGQSLHFLFELKQLFRF